MKSILDLLPFALLEYFGSELKIAETLAKINFDERRTLKLPVQIQNPKGDVLHLGVITKDKKYFSAEDFGTFGYSYSFALPVQVQ